MELKLSNNANLELLLKSEGTSGVSENFKGKASGIMIDGCPKINAKGIVDSVKTYQSTASANLKAVRMQLPYSSGAYSYTGTFDELSGYSVANGVVLSGYNSSGELKQRPSIVGLWSISDYVDSSMMDALTSATSGMYDVNEPALSAGYKIDWDEIAVQCVDSSKPNYNPAVAIILDNNLEGEAHDNTQHFGGKWWITKSDASNIRTIRHWFSSVSSVTDTKGIVSTDTTKEYDFTDFDEFLWFDGVSSIEISSFANNENLTSLKFPSTIESIPEQSFKGSVSLKSVGDIPDSVKSIGASAFVGCSELGELSFGNGISEIKESAFDGCSSLSVSSLPQNLTMISNEAFRGCENITVSEIPSGVRYIGTNSFSGCVDITSMHIYDSSMQTSIMSGAFDGGNYPIYVGNSDSAYLDENARVLYSHSANCSSFSDRLSSYYTKSYSGKIDSTSYDLQKYVISDGLNCIDTGKKYETGTKFETDICFTSSPSASADSIHGSESVGLDGKVSGGLQVTVDGATHTILSSEYVFGEGTHNYSINLSNSVVTMDGNIVVSSENPTVGDNSEITLFGDSTRKFSGKSWMNRISKDGTVTNDFVPVRRKSDNLVGFVDIKTGTFYGGNYYSSDEALLVAGDGNSNTIITEDGLKVEF